MKIIFLEKKYTPKELFAKEVLKNYCKIDTIIETSPKLLEKYFTTLNI